jgi:hypothetical protein
MMRQDKKPYITDVLMSKLGKPSPIVIFLAPVIISGENTKVIAAGLWKLIRSLDPYEIWLSKTSILPLPMGAIG